MAHQWVRLGYVAVLGATVVACLCIVLITGNGPTPASRGPKVDEDGSPQHSSSNAVGQSATIGEGRDIGDKIMLRPVNPPPSPGNTDTYVFDVMVKERSSEKPVSGEPVTLRLRGRLDAEGGRPRGPYDRILRGKTDQDGVCTFTFILSGIEATVASLERSYAEVPVFPARVETAIGVPGHYEVTLWAPKPTRFEGVVVDASGSPVAKASIATLPFHWQQPSVTVEADGSLAHPVVAITAEDGTFAFDMRKANGPDFVVIAAHEDYGISDCYIPLSQFSDAPAEPMCIVLKRGSRLAFQVVDSFGKALSRFQLPLFESPVSMAQRKVLTDKKTIPPLFTVLTDSDGAARLTLSDVSEIVVPFTPLKPLVLEEIDGTRIQIKGTLVSPTYQNPAIRLIPGACVETKVVLHSKERLVGRVVDEMGNPVHGATLRQNDIFAKSDEHGRFSFDGESKIVRRLPIIIEAKGFVPRTVCLDDEAAAGVDGLVIRLFHYSIFKIRIVPAPRRVFLVQGSRKDGRYEMLGRPVEGKKEEKGYGIFVFYVDVDHEDKPYDLYAIMRLGNGNHEGLCFLEGVIHANETYVSGEIRQFVVDESAILKTRLYLTVRDEEAAVSKDIRVRLRPRYVYAGSPPVLVQVDQIDIEETFRLDRKGQVEITDLQRGIYDVGVYVASSNGNERFACMNVTLDESEHTATLSLPSPGSYGRLQITILEKDTGRPIRGYIAEVHDRTSKLVGRRRFANAQGVVDVDGLSPGRYTITVFRYGPGKFESSAVVESGQTTYFTIEL